ncbi:helix-turn-helix domain-containing protein [Roseovarius pacificus]|uniref:helix-turn-helix domain-containing protein n=1 Tax=Roseovarius pacificus TaxID=337701 RepID=UPI002969DCA9|nr:helix-turn-helix domain-containing protein [Roseovarius pacificus]
MSGLDIDKALKRTRAKTPTERFVLALYARHAGKDLLAWPGQELLARSVGVGERQVRNAVRKLEALGELQLVRRGYKGRSTNVYRVSVLAADFDLIEHEANRQSSAGSVDPETGNPVPVVKTGKPETERHRNRHCSSDRRDTEEPAPRLSTSGPCLEGRKFAEKASDHLSVTPSRSDHIESTTVAGNLGNRAREDFDHLADDDDFEAWLREQTDDPNQWAAE